MCLRKVLDEMRDENIRLWGRASVAWGIDFVLLWFELNYLY